LSFDASAGFSEYKNMYEFDLSLINVVFYPDFNFSFWGKFTFEKGVGEGIPFFPKIHYLLVNFSTYGVNLSASGQCFLDECNKGGKVDFI